MPLTARFHFENPFANIRFRSPFRNPFQSPIIKVGEDISEPEPVDAIACYEAVITLLKNGIIREEEAFHHFEEIYRTMS